MSWPKVLVLAVALLLGLVLHGGLYTVTTLGSYPLRTNRLTGRVEMYYGSSTAAPRWLPLETAPSR